MQLLGYVLAKGQWQFSTLDKVGQMLYGAFWKRFLAVYHDAFDRAGSDFVYEVRDSRVQKNITQQSVVTQPKAEVQQRPSKSLQVYYILFFLPLVWVDDRGWDDVFPGVLKSMQTGSPRIGSSL